MPPPAEESSGNVLIGYGTPAATGARRRRADRAGPHRRPGRPRQPGPAGVSPGGRVISPLVRKLARDAGLDLATVRGTGPSGIVRRCDIEQAARASAAGTPIKTDTAPAAADRIAAATETGETRIPLRGVRRAVADKLTRSRREIPEATVWVDVDATELLAARAVLNTADPGPAGQPGRAARRGSPCWRCAATPSSTPTSTGTRSSSPATSTWGSRPRPTGAWSSRSSAMPTGCRPGTWPPP